MLSIISPLLLLPDKSISVQNFYFLLTWLGVATGAGMVRAGGDGGQYCGAVVSRKAPLFLERRVDV
jgi:hypothetical protein